MTRWTALLLLLTALAAPGHADNGDGPDAPDEPEVTTWDSSHGHTVTLRRRGDEVEATFADRGQELTYRGQFAGDRLALRRVITAEEFSDATPAALRARLLGRVQKYFDLVRMDDGKAMVGYFRGDAWSWDTATLELRSFRPRGTDPRRVLWWRQGTPRPCRQPTQCPCEARPSPDLVMSLWGWLANHSLQTADVTALTSAAKPATPYTFESGWGLVRTDFYGLVACLPEDMRAVDLLRQARDDINSLAGGSFTRVGWPKADGERQLHDVVDLDIWGPDNGAVAYVDVDLSDLRYCIVTATNAASGTHPVSGTRCWAAHNLGLCETLIYTYGIESSNTPGTGGIGAQLQDSLWEGMVSAFAVEVTDGGGKACRGYSDDEWHTYSTVLKLEKASSFGIVAPSLLDHTGELDSDYDPMADVSGE